MTRNRRSSNRSVWITLAFFVLVVILYVVYTNQSSPPAAPTPTDTPTVLSGQATPTVEIGHPIKTTGCKSDGILPDRGCTPGAIDPNVNQQMINGTICIVGYSGSVRPDTDITNPIKKAQMLAYGFTGAMSDYELDHLISLELGGCPDCVSNLWPEPYSIPMGAKEKDKVKNYLHKAVCNGEMTLAEAQWEIATDWTAVYYRVYGK